MGKKSGEMTPQEQPELLSRYFPLTQTRSIVVLGKTPDLLTLVIQAWIEHCAVKYFMVGWCIIELWHRAI